MLDRRLAAREQADADAAREWPRWTPWDAQHEAAEISAARVKTEDSWQTVANAFSMLFQS